jgi:predicted DNA-binding transcriptional regulator AlpA
MKRKRSLYKDSDDPNDSTNESPFMTRKQIADRLQICPETLDRHRKRSEGFPDPIEIGACMRWKKSDIEFWEKNQATA